MGGLILKKMLEIGAGLRRKEASLKKGVRNF